MMKVKQLNVGLLCAALTQQTLLAAVYANPAGATVVNGQVNFSQLDANTLQITNSPSAIINWQQFNIGSQEITRFVQDNASSAVLNRVISGNASEIFGQLQSNGQVFLINPNGLVIGQDAVINTAGFIGSTLNISDQDFLNRRMHFEGDNAGDIDNQGYIHAGDNGDILLIAPNITNSGVLEVDGGNILLAAGQSITIASIDDANISFEVQASEDSVTNLGEIIANNGAASLFAGTLTHSGSISANGITQDAAGNIRLVAQGTNWIEGTVTATGNIGGDIQLLGEQVGLAGNAVIDASGQNGGGQILIGGDYQGQGDIQTARATYVGEDVQIKADALGNGDGGRVIVWSDETTRMYGGISATGGALSGDGGFIETSGGFLDIGNIVPDVSAPMGEGGTWLLDPNNISISAIVGSPPFNLPGGTPFISEGDNAILPIDVLQGALGNGNVVIQTSTAGANAQAGDITWNSGADLDLAGLGTRTLTLNAHNDIIILGSIGFLVTPGPVDALTLNINADIDNNGSGGFTLGSTASLDLAVGTGIGTLDVNASSDIVLDGTINTGTAVGNSVTLISNAGSISQSLSSSIVTDNLVATSSGNMDYLGGNSISNLNAVVNGGSNLTFNNSAALTIGVIDALGGTVTLNNSNAIDQIGAIGGIVAGALDVTASGNVSLTDSANDVDSVTVSDIFAGNASLSFSFTDTDDLEVQNVNINNTNASTGASAFIDITSGGNMTLNGNIDATGDALGFSGITLNAQNGGNIVYQSGTITSDAVNFQNDANLTTVGPVGSAANPIQTAALNTNIEIIHGSNGGSGPAQSGGDLYLLNTSGGLTVLNYMPQTASALQIENTAGNIDLSTTTLLDSLGITTDQLTATSIFLKASGNLFLPTEILGKPAFESRLASTVGNIYLEGQDLTVDVGDSITSAGNVTLVANAGSLQILDAVDSTSGNVELRADAFNITGAVTAQNQVVVREFSAVQGLEVNDGTPTAGFATLTTNDLGLLTGTDLGLVLGNDLASAGSKQIRLVSNIDSSMINGTALTFDTTNNSTGFSTAVVAANIDFTTGNENLLFTGNGSALIESSQGPILVDTGNGNLSSNLNSLVISGFAANQTVVKANNADIASNLTVISGDSAGSFASFEGNNLTVQGTVDIFAIADSAEVNFTNNVTVNSPSVVSVSGGIAAGAFAKLVGGSINITADAITLNAGTGTDADAFISAGGQGSVTLAYASCIGCDNRLSSDPLGNGLSDTGIFASTTSLNGSVVNDTGNLNPIPALDSLLANFSAGYVEPIEEDDEDDDKLSVCQ